MSTRSGPGELSRLLERFIANPVLRVVLKSPLHRLVGNRLALLSYRGRRTGIEVSTPVMTVPDGAARVVTTYREGVTWWRNFRDGHPATLWIAGQPHSMEGRAETDPDAVAEWLQTLADRENERLLGFFGLSTNASRAEIETAAEEIVVVRFEPRS